jgi:hypothetical protein
MPDVRCAFGLIGYSTRRSSLTPSTSTRPGFCPSVVTVRSNSAGMSPARTGPVPGASSDAGAPAPAAFFSARPGKSNTQTILRASAHPVLTPRRRVSTSFAGWAPFVAAPGSLPATAAARAAGRTEACNAQPYRLALHRCAVRPQSIRFPEGYRPPSRHGIYPFRHAHQLQRSHLTPACSGLAALAADARR